MQRLSADASGLRHLRWAREILGTLDAHFEHDAELSAAQRDAVLSEAVALREVVVALSGAVKPYRDFLERERTRYRGMVRVGRFLVAEARGSEHRLEAETVARGLEDVFAVVERRETAPRKAAVRAAVATLHEALAAMDARLAAATSTALVESLYPPLTADASRVADVGDPDDDSST